MAVRSTVCPQGTGQLSIQDFRARYKSPHLTLAERQARRGLSARHPAAPSAGFSRAACLAQLLRTSASASCGRSRAVRTGRRIELCGLASWRGMPGFPPLTAASCAPSHMIVFRKLMNDRATQLILGV